MLMCFIYVMDTQWMKKSRNKFRNSWKIWTLSFHFPLFLGFSTKILLLQRDFPLTRFFSGPKNRDKGGVPVLIKVKHDFPNFRQPSKLALVFSAIFESVVKSGWNIKRNILLSSSRAFSLSTPLENSAVCQH